MTGVGLTELGEEELVSGVGKQAVTVLCDSGALKRRACGPNEVGYLVGNLAGRTRSHLSGQPPESVIPCAR